MTRRVPALGALSAAVLLLVREAADRVRRRGRTSLTRAVRLTGAAVTSYVVARELGLHPQPLLAPLTALLVVQVTLFSIVTSSVQRVASVVAGVALAVGFASVVPLTWWSLGALIAASIVVGTLLRLGDHLLEVPISAMLVLGVGAASAESAAEARIAETLVGALVGVLVNVAFPPAVRTRDAGRAVEGYAGELADFLDRLGHELDAGASEEQAARWLDDARRLNRRVSRVDRVLVHAEESRRLNPRALGRPDTGPALRSGLDALEHCSVAIRSMCRAIADEVRARPETEPEHADDVRQAFAVLMHDLATAVRGFGRLVRAEVEASADAEQSELATALEALGEARVRVTELLLLVPRDSLALWQLNTAVLATVERVLAELDMSERVRPRAPRVGESRAGLAVERLRTTTRQLADLPRRRSGRGGDGGGGGGGGAGAG